MEFKKDLFTNVSHMKRNDPNKKEKKNRYVLLGL